jgi:shikimate kinase
VNRAQGNTRQAPDGFLHIQNFTVTKHSGMAGVVYTHVLDDHQKSLVEGLLIERAITVGLLEGEDLHHFKHGAWRFRKEFLKNNFKEVVHATTKIMQNPVIETFKGKLFDERESLTY